ncbi:MAG: SIMPL domain-containing protein [Oscillospiraceae bacterium]|nr:SIMPL domain-containing protein [Oscillospiraceae bacterium]
MRTIRITGTGQLKLRPDVTVITMDLTGLCPDYSEAMNKSSEDTESLKKALAPLGFDSKDIKTTNFDFGAKFDSHYDNGKYIKEFLGYKYIHELKIEFDSDNRRLGEILSVLVDCGAKPEFEISYTIKDKESAKNELLAKAVVDARRKAELLANAAGVRLKDIQSIDYSWGKIDFNIRPMSRSSLPEGDYGAFDIEPDDIDLSDTVTVIWEIE